MLPLSLHSLTLIPLSRPFLLPIFISQTHSYYSLTLPHSHSKLTLFLSRLLLFLSPSLFLPASPSFTLLPISLLRSSTFILFQYESSLLPLFFSLHSPPLSVLLFSPDLTHYIYLPLSISHLSSPSNSPFQCILFLCHFFMLCLLFLLFPSLSPPVTLFFSPTCVSIQIRLSFFPSLCFSLLLSLFLFPPLSHSPFLVTLLPLPPTHSYTISPPYFFLSLFLCLFVCILFCLFYFSIYSVSLISFSLFSSFTLSSYPSLFLLPSQSHSHMSTLTRMSLQPLLSLLFFSLSIFTFFTSNPSLVSLSSTLTLSFPRHSHSSLSHSLLYCSPLDFHSPSLSVFAFMLLIRLIFLFFFVTLL